MAEQWDLEQRKHYSKERSFWRNYILVTLVAVLLSGASALLAFAAFRSSLQAAESAADALKEARRQANAAEAQTGISRDTEQRQLRAYIGIVPPTDNQVANAFFPPAKPFVRLVPKNFGLTPAYEVVHQTGLSIEAYPLPKALGYPIQKSQAPSNPVPIYPGGPELASIVADANRPLTNEEVAAIQDGTRYRLYVWGTMNYKDVFGGSHHTNFCMNFYNLTPQQVQRDPCAEHNDSD